MWIRGVEDQLRPACRVGAQDSDAQPLYGAAGDFELPELALLLCFACLLAPPAV